MGSSSVKFKFRLGFPAHIELGSPSLVFRESREVLTPFTMKFEQHWFEKSPTSEHCQCGYKRPSLVMYVGPQSTGKRKKVL